jgi:hypothetical protein
MMNAPGATSATKLRALEVAEAFVDDGTFRDLVNEHAATRQRDEAAKGVASFRERRAARWYPGVDGSGCPHTARPAPDDPGNEDLVAELAGVSG